MTARGDNRELRNRAREARERGLAASDAAASTGSSKQQHHRPRDDEHPDAEERARDVLERPHDNPRDTRPGRRG